MAISRVTRCGRGVIVVNTACLDMLMELKWLEGGIRLHYCAMIGSPDREMAIKGDVR